MSNRFKTIDQHDNTFHYWGCFHISWLCCTCPSWSCQTCLSTFCFSWSMLRLVCCLVLAGLSWRGNCRMMKWTCVIGLEGSFRFLSRFLCRWHLGPSNGQVRSELVKSRFKSLFGRPSSLRFRLSWPQADLFSTENHLRPISIRRLDLFSNRVSSLNS